MNQNGNKDCSVHIDYGVSKDCKNPDTYGYICVKCEQCGRKFGINTNKQNHNLEVLNEK